MTIVLLWGQPSTKMPGGAEQFTDLLQQAIPGLKVVYPAQQTIPSWPLLSEPAKAFGAAQTLSEQLAVLRPEIVLYNGMFGWALPEKTPYTKIALCHGTFPSFARHALSWGLNRLRTQFIYADFEKKSYANADYVVCNSAFTQKNLANDYGLSGKVIPLATDTRRFHSVKNSRKKLGLPEDKKIILFVGRPTHDKGFDMVERVAQNHPEWHVVAVTNPRGKSSHVDCRGPLPFDELTDYYAACDVVFFPSRFESFGYVTIEALAAKKPVVTTPFGIAPEINHPACIVVNEFSADAFERALMKALSQKYSFDEKKRKYYDLPRFQKDYQQLIREVRS